MTLNILKVDTPNSNGRIYTRDAMQKALEKIAGAPVMVSLGVQEVTQLDMGKIAGVMTNLRIDEDGNVVGEFTRLNLPAAETLDKLSDMAYTPVGLGVLEEGKVIKDYTLQYIAAIPSALAAKY